MNGKKFLALLLSALMVIGMIPFTVFASETSAQTTEEQTAADPHVEPQLTSDAVVFVSNEYGDDENEGSIDFPVQTLTQAVTLLGSEGGTVVLYGNVDISAEPLSSYDYTYEKTEEGVTTTVTETLVDGRYQMPSHKGLVYITSVYDGVDYAADNGAQLTFGNWNDHGSTKSNHFILGGPTTFENVNFACSTNPVFYGRGNFITMGENITSDVSLLVLGYNQGTHFSDGDICSTDKDTHIILKSGNYHTVSGMNRQTADGTYLGTAYITIGEGVGTVGTLVGLGEGVVGGYYGNAVIEINGGTFTTVAGAAHNSTNADFGNVTMTVNKATVSGRFDGMSNGGDHCKFGNAKTVVNAGTFNTIEGFTFGTKFSVYGNSDLTINGGSYKWINGVLMADAGIVTNNIVADAVTTFNAGTVSDNLCGGSYRNDFKADNVTLNINGGTFAKAVVGLNMTGDVTVNDSINLNVTAGTFNSYVCAASYGNNAKASTTVTGGANVHINVSGGAFNHSGASLMLAYKCTSSPKLGRCYYNVSGGTINKIYVGARYAPAINGGGMYFTYSGGDIGTISTAWLTGYQKYYFVGDKTYETTTFSTSMTDQGKVTNGWPSEGDNAFNYINIGENYPEAVYVLNVNEGGDYVNDGLTPDTPIESIYDAAVTLGPDGGTIYLMGDIPAVYTPESTGTLTYSAILPGETEPNGATINLDASNLYFESDVVFDGITFRSTVGARLIAFQGHNVTINDNCQMVLTDADTGSTGSIELIMGYSQNTDEYWNGGRNAEQISVYNDQIVNINGGEWIGFTGGNKRFSQYASVGTYYGDVIINIGEGATFTNNTPIDDTYAQNAVYLTGANIIKGNVTANLAGTFKTPVYGVGRLGVYYNGVNVTFNSKSVYFLGTDGITMRDDTKYEGNITVNATGNFTLEGGPLSAICRAGDTPLYGNFTLNTTGGTFADGMISDAKGVIGTATYVGDAGVKTYNYATVNGKGNKSSDPIRVITVGDSITWGTCATSSEVDGYSYHLYNNNYPAQLAKLLGEGAVVGNFGYPGAHAFYGNTKDYFGSSAYGLSMQFGDADAIIIALGTNDQANVAVNGVINQAGADIYLTSMRRLIEDYHAAYPNATIYITTALPRWTSEASTANTYNVVIPLQKQLAGEYEYTKLMDLFTDMKPYADIDEANGTDLYFHTDKLHPNNGGYAVMGAAVSKYLKADFHYYAHEAKEATCTAIGCDHYACIWCDDYYNENETPALGHDIYEDERVEATTEADGYVNYKCSRCDYATQEILPMLGKTYTEFEVFAPTCTEQGFTRHYCDQDDSYYDDTFVAALGHDHVITTVEAKCTETGSITTTCSRCDYSKVESIAATGHTAGDEATCTKNQVCTVCGSTLVEAFGHDLSTVVIAPTETTAGYTLTSCSRGDHAVKSNWVDATEKIVVFVDTTVSATGDGSVDAPFKTYTEACLYANVSFDRTIVLMSMVPHTSNYVERDHTGHYTVTSSYDGVDYGGGFNFKGAYHYVLSGDTTFENMTFTLASSLVVRAKFHTLVLGEGIMNDGKFYVVGADQDSKSAADPSQDVNITILSGKYFEVVGGYRSGGPANITGTINIYVGGTAEIDKLFIGHRSCTSKAITNANLTLDGGIINIFVTASDVQKTTAATGAPKGIITVNVTKNFDVTKSFTQDGGVSFAGFSLSTAIMGHETDTLNTSGTYILNIDAAVYNTIMESGKVNEISISEINLVNGVEGDIDLDGELTNADITILVRYLSGWDVEGNVLDVTADDKINNRDAIYLVQKLAGWYNE